MDRTRYLRIVWFFAGVVAHVVFWDLFLRRIGLQALSRRTRPERMQKIAVHYRALAIRMGGVLIKVGQFLSTRVDVLPIEITQELAGLQDEVPAEKYEDIRRVAEAELGAPLHKCFAEFDEEPLAAASLGQVHRARLFPRPRAERPTPPAGTRSEPDLNPDWATHPADAIFFTDIVVKVQRPRIEQIIKTDLAALRTVGNWLKRYPPIRRRADVPALLEEFSNSLYEEIDYLAEGRNAETFAANFRWDWDHVPGIRVPRVVWTFTTRRVLTLENMRGIKITDYEALEKAGIDRGAVAQHLFETYLKQIFTHGFFHADPHPGNLFVTPVPHLQPLSQSGEGHTSPSPDGRGARGEGSGGTWELTFIDFGMVGRVPENLHDGLREVLIATGTQDARRMIKAYQIMGVLLPTADLDLLEQAEEKLFQQFWGKSMAELQQISFEEMQEFGKEFRELIYNMPFQVPENLILLGRTVAILSGMCTGLNPNFNIWESLTPVAQKMIAEDAADWGFWQTEAEKLLRGLAALPGRIDRALTRIEEGKLEIRTPDVRAQTRQLEAGFRRVTGAIIFAALLLGGIQLMLGGVAWGGGVLLTGAFVSLAWALRQGS